MPISSGLEGEVQGVLNTFGTVQGAQAAVGSAEAVARDILNPAPATAAIDRIISQPTYAKSVVAAEAIRVESRAGEVVDSGKTLIQLGLRALVAETALRNLGTNAVKILETIKSVPTLASHLPQEVAALVTHLPQEVPAALALVAKVGVGTVALHALAIVAGTEQVLSVANAGADVIAAQKRRRAERHVTAVALQTQRELLAEQAVKKIAASFVDSQPGQVGKRRLDAVANDTISNLATKQAIRGELQRALNKLTEKDGEVKPRKVRTLARLILAYYSDRLKDPETTHDKFTDLVKHAAEANAEHVGRLFGFDFPDRTRTFNGFVQACIAEFNAMLQQYQENPNDTHFAGRDIVALRKELTEIRTRVLDLNQHPFLFKAVYKWKKIQPVVKQLEQLLLAYADLLPSQAQVVDTIQVAENLQVRGLFGRLLHYGERRGRMDYLRNRLYSQFSDVVTSLEIKPEQKKSVEKNRRLRDAVKLFATGGPEWVKAGIGKSAVDSASQVYQIVHEIINDEPLNPENPSEPVLDILVNWIKGVGESFTGLQWKKVKKELEKEIKDMTTKTSLIVGIDEAAKIMGTPSDFDIFHKSIAILGIDGGKATWKGIKNLLYTIQKNISLQGLRELLKLVPYALAFIAPDVIEPIKEIFTVIDLPDIINNDIPPILP